MTLAKLISKLLGTEIEYEGTDNTGPFQPVLKTSDPTADEPKRAAEPPAAETARSAARLTRLKELRERRRSEPTGERQPDETPELRSKDDLDIRKEEEEEDQIILILI